MGREQLAVSVDVEPRLSVLGEDEGRDPKAPPSHPRGRGDRLANSFSDLVADRAIEARNTDGSIDPRLKLGIEEIFRDADREEIGKEQSEEPDIKGRKGAEAITGSECLGVRNSVRFIATARTGMLHGR